MTAADEQELTRLRARCAELETRIAEGTGVADPETTANTAPGPGRNALFSAIQSTRMPMILTDPQQPDNPIIFANSAFVKLSGYSADELVGRNCRFLQGADTMPETVAKIREAIAARTTIAIDIVNYRKDGSRFINELYVSPVFGPAGDLLYFFGSQVDVTAYTETRLAMQLALIERERHVLGQIAEGVPLGEVLEGLLKVVQAQDEHGMRSSILFLSEDGLHLRHGAAPSLPAAYNDAVDGIAICEGNGSCGTAASRGEPVYVADIATDPLWKDYRDLALENGLRACWSTPIKGADGAVLGTFATYYDKPRSPSKDQIAAIGFVTQTAAMVIERHRHDRQLIRGREEFRGLNAELATTNRRLQAAIGVADLGTFRWDTVTGAVELDTRSRLLFGFDPEHEVDADAVFGRIDPDVLPAIQAEAMASVAERRAHDLEYPIIRPDGSRRVVHSVGDLVSDDDGSAYMFGTFADITARIDADQRLRESEARYRTLFDAVDAGFCVIEVKFDDDGRAIDYRHEETNPAFERQTGLYGKEGLWVSEVVPDLERHWFDTYGEVAATGKAVRFENHAEPLGRWFDVHAFCTAAPGGNRVAVLFNDITERKAIEQELRDLNFELEQRVEERSASVRLYRDMVQSDDAPVVAFDKDMKIVAFNKAHHDAYSRVYGIDQQVGDSLLDQFVADQATVVRGFMERSLAGESFVVREAFGDPDIEKPSWQISYNPLRDEQDRVIGGFHRALDITAELRAQAELAKTQDALRQAQKMEAVGQLTGGLAHDFNNLLTGMLGNLELLQMRVARGRLDDLDRFILAAQGAGRRAAALTQRLLAFSRRQTLDPKPTDVNRLVAGMDDLLRRTVGPSTEIEVVGAAGLRTANIDAGQLENALLNLCINARDAMPDGGRITIETANKWMDERTARERDIPPGQYLSVCVTDTGTGMPPEIIERVFEPFFTTKPLGEGTGLGLSMIYGFARQSNGQVRIYSEVGQGTTICIYLPRHLGEALSGADEEVIASAANATGETILVVDDEATIRHLIDEVLDDAGYTVIGAADGAAGLKVLQSGARIELLITDVGLPGGMNGRQVADAARALRPGLKVLFITGYAENAAVGNGHLEPGMELLTKPFSMEALTAKVVNRRPTGTPYRRVKGTPSSSSGRSMLGAPSALVAA